MIKNHQLPVPVLYAMMILLLEKRYQLHHWLKHVRISNGFLHFLKIFVHPPVLETPVTCSKLVSQ